MEQTASDLYNVRVTERQSYLEEAHRSALVTIPALIPDMQDVCTRSAPVVLAKPFQSLGARGVNNLASKLLLTLFPPTAPFMKYEMSSQTREEAEAAGEGIAEIKALLARREQRIQAEVDIQNIRVKGFLVLRQLFVAGNCLVYADPSDSGLQVYPLNSYVVKRDGKGNLLDLIYVDKLSRSSVEDPRVLEILASQPEMQDPAKKDEPVLLFTRVMRDGKKFKSWQEVMGIKVPDSEDSHTEETLPWLALRYTSIDGEDYGRGFVEEYRGDLTSFEQMSRDMLFASANAAKVVWAIDPTSPLKPKKFIEAPNGTAVNAGPDDVSAIRLDKGGDMSVVFQQMRELQNALAADFLLNSSFQRNQERVTAEEIRRMAEELDDTLGGVFSLLSQELQLPLARLLETSLVKQKELKPLPKDTVRIGIVTGLAAIGRGQDLMRLRETLSLVGEAALIVPGLPDYINEDTLNTMIWTGGGVDTNELLLSEEEVAEKRQAAAQQAQAQNLGAEAARGVGNSVGSADPAMLAQAMIPQE